MLDNTSSLNSPVFFPKFQFFNSRSIEPNPEDNPTYAVFMKSNINTNGKIKFSENIGKVISTDECSALILDGSGQIVRVKNGSYKLLNNLNFFKRKRIVV